MMRKRTWWAIGGLALAVFAGGADAPAAKSSPEDVLKGLGLTRSGKLFILQDEEAEFLKQLDPLRPVLDRLDEARFRIMGLADQEAKLEAMEQAMGLYDGQVRMLDDFIRQQGGRNSVAKQEAIANRRVLVSERAALRPQLDAARRSRLSPMQQRQLFAEFAARRQEFVDRAREAQPAGEAVRAKYAEIAREFKAKDALKHLRDTAKARVDLGPSPAFNNSWKGFLTALNGAKTPEEIVADAQKKARSAGKPKKGTRAR